MVKYRKVLKFKALIFCTLEERQTLLETRGKSSKYENEKADLRRQQKKIVNDFDQQVILQLDEKVSDQQSMLEKAGVPGFYLTHDPSEIKVQMYLLKFILKLGTMKLPYVCLD